MKRPALIVGVAMLTSACQVIVVDDDPVMPAPPEPLVTVQAFAEPSTPSTTVTTAAAHEPIWVTVRYRSDPVDVAYPGRFDVMVPDSTLVSAAAFDSAHRYLLVALNGVWYHYCDVPVSVWSALGDASSKARFYNSELRGSYDCRLGGVPDYS